MKPSTGTIEIVEYDELVAHFLRTRGEPKPAVETDWLTVDEAAAYCKLAKGTIYNAIYNGDLQKCPTKRKVLIHKAVLEKFLTRKK